MRRIHTISFHHALSGIFHALRTQPNFVVHLSLSLVVVLSGLFFHISNTQWLIIILTIFIGLAVELINTAIETTVDLLTDQYHILAKIAKDTASGAMLIYAIGSVIIALVIFLPKLWLYI